MLLGAEMEDVDLKNECKRLRYEAIRAYFDGDTKHSKELSKKADEIARKIDERSPPVLSIGENHESS